MGSSVVLTSASMPSYYVLVLGLRPSARPRWQGSPCSRRTIVPSSIVEFTASLTSILHRGSRCRSSRMCIIRRGKVKTIEVCLHLFRDICDDVVGKLLGFKNQLMFQVTS